MEVFSLQQKRLHTIPNFGSNSNKNGINFGAKIDTFESKKKKKGNNNTKLIVGSSILAGSIGVFIGVLSGKVRFNSLNRRFSELRGSYESLRRVDVSNTNLKKELDQTKNLLEESNLKNKTLTEQSNTFSDIINKIPDEEVFKIDREKRLDKLRKKINDPELGYDPQDPPKIYESDSREILYNHKFDYIEQPLSTGIRGNIPEFSPPKLEDIKTNGLIEFKIPDHGGINSKIAENAHINPEKIGENNTNFAKNYGEALNWSNDKIARDILQNFYDGHGQTTEGVKLNIVSDFTNNAERKYKVRISGESEYNHRAVEVVGAGTKHNDRNSAGNYGEGSKMVAIKMLSNNDVPSVTYSSADWKLTYKIGDSNGKNKEDIYKNLEKLPEHQKGNYIEFETKNEKLVQSILDSTNYFYHPGNPDFKSPTFENKDWGFKLLSANPNETKGNIYLANQRYEYNNADKWKENVPNLTIYFKKKPGVDVLDTGRDRTHITSEEVRDLAGHFGKESSNQEIVNAISSLKDLWSPHKLSKKYDIEENKASNLAGVKLLGGLLDVAKDKKIKINFSEKMKLVSFPQYGEVADNILNDLTQKGYTICHKGFNKIGMKSVDDLLKEMKNHNAIVPTPAQVKKIKIIDEATEAIAKAAEVSKLTKNSLSVEDARKPTYLFDRTLSKDSKDTLGEAITSGGYFDKTYHGHWIDSNYLNKAPFSEVLATRVHEMSHKHGGDGQESFSYKLTDVIGDMSEVIVNSPDTRRKLVDLQSLWNEVK